MTWDFFKSTYVPVSVSFVSWNECRFLIRVSLPSCWTKINNFLSIQSRNFQHVEIVKNTWWWWLVNEVCCVKYLGGIMSIFSNLLCFSITFGISIALCFIMIVLNAKLNIWCRFNGKCYVFKNLGQFNKIVYVLASISAWWIYHID